jgi:hypothetical protein
MRSSWAGWLAVSLWIAFPVLFSTGLIDLRFLNHFVGPTDDWTVTLLVCLPVVLIPFLLICGLASLETYLANRPTKRSTP